MSIILFRVDERLIHGQVVVGWGSVIAPDQIIVVDDEIAESAWERELYSIGLPPEIEAHFHTIEEARQLIDEWRADDRRTILLTRDIRAMRRLAEGGLLEGEEINLGGLHAAPGRVEVLPYLYLSPDERAELLELHSTGAIPSARDLPRTRSVPLTEILEGRLG